MRLGRATTASRESSFTLVMILHLSIGDSSGIRPISRAGVPDRPSCVSSSGRGPLDAGNRDLRGCVPGPGNRRREAPSRDLVCSGNPWDQAQGVEDRAPAVRRRHRLVAPRAVRLQGTGSRSGEKPARVEIQKRIDELRGELAAWEASARMIVAVQERLLKMIRLARDDPRRPIQRLANRPGSSRRRGSPDQSDPAPRAQGRAEKGHERAAGGPQEADARLGRHGPRFEPSADEARLHAATNGG